MSHDPVALARTYMTREDFIEALGHPQAYDWCVACAGYKHSYTRWLWEQAYAAAREQITEWERQADDGPYGRIK